MADLNKLTEPQLFFAAHRNVTLCLDEIQLLPHLFTVLRGEIDSDRRPGRFIPLGSASQALIQKSSESLAGRVGILELGPFTIDELIKHDAGLDLTRYWSRGGYPDSYLAADDEAAWIWREDFIKTYAQRDLPMLGFSLPIPQMRRFMTMCAHLSGQILNASKLGESLGVAHTTVRRYLDLLEQTFLVRLLPPLIANVKKRLIKSPKIYIRDSGLLHRLLHIGNYNDLLGNPMLGASWEGMVVENLCSLFADCECFFYRSASGDELDLILRKAGRTIAVECKASSAPQLGKGFRRALEVVQADKTFVVAPINGRYPLHDNVWACSLPDAISLLADELR
jgi:predicted AAA+ superfamily ATPase